MEIPQLFTVGLDGSGLRLVTDLCSGEPTWSVGGAPLFRGRAKSRLRASTRSDRTARSSASGRQSLLAADLSGLVAERGRAGLHRCRVRCTDQHLHLRCTRETDAPVDKARRLPARVVTRWQVHRVHQQQRPLCDRAKRTWLTPHCQRASGVAIPHLQSVARSELTVLAATAPLSHNHQTTSLSERRRALRLVGLSLHRDASEKPMSTMTTPRIPVTDRDCGR